MFIYESNDENIPTDTEAYYEAVASQEEIYLEETEEKLRVILEPTIRLHHEASVPINNVRMPLKNFSPEILMILHSAKRQSRKCLG